MQVPLRAGLALAPLLLGLTATTAEAAWPGLNGRISLTQRVDAANGVRANRDVFAYALDGTRDRVTTSTDNEEQSSWSPDGRWVAYKRREAVWVGRWDAGVEPVALTTPSDGDINNTQPAWSPDMKRILFRTNRSDTNVPRSNVADIWVMDSPFGANPGEPSARPLVVRPGDERYPTFSPDGRKLLFRGDDDGIAPSNDEEIYVANADGTGITALTDDGALDSAPAWSPDGTRIAWESNRDGLDREIYVMDADGTDVVRLTDNDLHDEGPAWSPDGRYITFTRAATETQPGDVWVMNADGTEPRQLTSTPIIEESPDWQPLPVDVGARWAPRTPCSDDVLAVGMRCERALRLVARPRPPRAFRCASEVHSFGQTVTQCERKRSWKGYASVQR